jgi:hypothetical protein
MDRRNNPVFIVGCPRSGTTLLAVLLNRHSRIAITPETAFYDEIAPQLPHRDVRELLLQWRRFAELGLSVEAVMERCGEAPGSARLFGSLIESYAHTRGKLISGEKTPQHLKHVPRMLAEFPEARVVCLIRDGRDVALSLRAMPWWSGGLEAGAAAWLEAIDLSERFASELSGRFRRVRYEDLIHEPEVELERIGGFLGIAPEPGQLEPGRSDVVLPRSLVWKGLATGAIDASRARHRRMTAGSSEIGYLNEVLGPALHRSGYGSADGISPARLLMNRAGCA